MTFLKGKIGRAIIALKKNKALSTLILMLVIVNTIVAASVAWFTINRQASVDKLGMSLAVDNTSAVYKAYMYNLENGKGTDENPDGTPLTIEGLDLNQYDTIFRAQNKYTPAFAKIEIVKSSSMSKSGTVFITIERNSNEKTDPPQSEYSSSVLRFTAFIIKGKSDITKTTADELYTFINSKERFEEVETYFQSDHEERPHSKTFVTVNGEGAGHTHVKSNTITLSVDYTEEDDVWYVNQDGHEAMNVYLYVTYDVELVDCYMDEHSGGGVSLDDNTFYSKNDLKRISVSYVNKEN